MDNLFSTTHSSIHLHTDSQTHFLLISALFKTPLAIINTQIQQTHSQIDLNPSFN
jgi:hypothetical protein